MWGFGGESSRALRLSLAAFSAVGVWTLAPPAWAQEGDLRSLPEADVTAQGHFRLGTRLYREGDFAGAAREFEESYRLSERPELLYNLYLAYRDASEIRPAADALRRYLEAVPDAAERPQLEARLARMDAEIAAREAELAEAARRAEDAAEPREQTAPPDTPTPARRNPMRGVSFGLVGGGGAMLAGALATGLAARGVHADLERACGAGPCDPARAGDADRGRALAVATDVLWVTGAVAASAGLALLFTVGRAEDDGPDMQATARCDGTGCGLTAQVTFR
jgi:tetratricopeptide (TPR) repeat protein